MVPECKPEWNREAIMIFSRLPSLRRLQATLPLQTSLITGPYTTTTTVISTLNGVINKKSGSKDVSLVSACLTDVFSVSDQVCSYLPPTYEVLSLLVYIASKFFGI